LAEVFDGAATGTHGVGKKRKDRHGNTWSPMKDKLPIPPLSRYNDYSAVGRGKPSVF
jgi:hypothetical protein